jgi:hypothetical protein
MKFPIVQSSAASRSFFPLGPNVQLNTLFSPTLNLISSLTVRNQFSHPYKTTGEIIVLYVFNLKFSEGDGQTIQSELNGSKRSWSLICQFLRESNSPLLISFRNITDHVSLLKAYKYTFCI